MGKMKISDLCHWKTGNSKKISSQNILQMPDKDCSSPGMISRNIVGEDAYRERELVHEEISVDVTSTSGLSGNIGMLDICGSCNNNNLHVDREGARVGCEIDVAEDDYPHQPYTTDLGFSYRLRRNRSTLRSKQAIEHLIKPLNSLQSCLLAHLYNERAEMEECLFKSAPSSAPMVRPFFVTDGNQTSSGASGVFLSTPRGVGLQRLQKDVLLQENDAVFGVPQLPNIGSMRKSMANTGKDHNGSFSRKVNGKHCHSEGSSHGVFLVCLGISVGIFSSFLAHKKEVGTLNGLLKQTENLVQDLQEELEMRDSLTVKELATEDYESQYSSYNKELLHVFSPQKKLNNSSKHCFEEHHRQHSEGESISKIEAELEAELERLESNIDSFKLEGEYSEVVELDPDFIPDLAEGELRTDVSNRPKPCADEDGSGNSTPHPANYAVSPRELSLRLHQLIQSQLEERVRELENTLEHCQRKVRYMEALLSNQWRAFSNSEVVESPSTKGSLTKDNTDVINLAGEEALELYEYNGVFEDISKTIEYEPDGKSLGIRKISHKENMHHLDDNVDWIPNCTLDNDDVHDEMEKLLIKNIVEKVRRGSPAVLNDQTALFSQNGHS